MANRSRTALNPIFNLLASGFLVLSCLCMCAVAAVFALPSAAIPANLRPADLPTAAAVLDLTRPPTPTITDTPGPQAPTFPPTWTSAPPTLSPIRPTSTNTPALENTLPGDTRTPTHTYTPTLTPTRTFTPGPPTKTRSALPYTLQQGIPTYLSNYINTAGCNYMGIIGQAFNLDGKAELNLYVHLEGNGLNVDGITGSEPSIGPGAYKINLGNSPVTTTDIYKIQLRNSSGQPLSDVYTIPTFGDCKKNLILVNFEQNHR
jgi:hypothetical protein